MTDSVTQPQAESSPTATPPAADASSTASSTAPAEAHAMPSAEAGQGIVDTNLLGAAIGRLSPLSVQQGRAAFNVMSAFFEPDEQVEVLVQGRYLGEIAALALTNNRVLIANAREWKADVVEFIIGPSLTINGWQDDRNAALVIQDEHFSATFDSIGERTIAQQLAAGLRARVGLLPGS